MNFLKYFLITALMFLSSQSAFAQAPAHYYNDPANLNADPNYTPGEYALPEAHAAKTFYQAKKTALVEEYLKFSDIFQTLGIGEVSFSSTKNETATVLGYFRNYIGMVNESENGLETMKIIIDINSLDTAVPGRNNRILDIFFNSTNAELGTAEIVFDQFVYEEIEGSEEPTVEHLAVSGSIKLNGVEKEINAQLSVEYLETGIQVVKTLKPVQLSIADFNFGNRIYDLMKACNHKSIGDTVEVNVELYFK